MKQKNIILKTLKAVSKVAAFYISCLMVLPSCTKENVPVDGPGKEQGGERVISAQFDNSTKVALAPGGLVFTFRDGDKIRVSNSSQSEECTVNVVGGNALFVTTLEGELTAIYPSSAAVLTGGENSAIANPGFKVPASQDGDVAKAIIAKATIAAGSSKAVFTSQIALFEITPPSGTTSFKITSLKPVVSGARTGTATAINTTGTTDVEKLVINVTAVPSGGKAYVALKPGVKLSDLSFDAGGTYGMKGIPTKTITAAGKTDATAANTKYAINNTNWHPYVTIGGLKWATMNIGADSATDRGEYFAWGGVTGQTLSGSNTFSPGFPQSSAPYYNGSAYTKYTSSDGKTVLDLADDAAYVHWGGPWRMPTGEPDTGEFVVMWKSGFMAWDAGTNKGYYYFVPSEIGKSAGRGYLTDVSSDKRSLSKLFFPAVGASSGSNLGDAEICHYWSSSLSPSNKGNACYIKAGGYGTSAMYMIPEQFIRYSGRSVRPVADP